MVSIKPAGYVQAKLKTEIPLSDLCPYIWGGMTMRFPEEIPENERAGRADLCLYLSPRIK
jgi:hypothetical protein